MRRLGSILDRREEVARLYRRYLGSESGLTLPVDAIPGVRVSWFVYVVRLVDSFSGTQRNEVIRDLQQAGIGCGRYFAPIHLQPAYADLAAREDLRVTESVAARTIALPFFNRINDSQVSAVCDVLKQALRRIS